MAQFESCSAIRIEIKAGPRIVEPCRQWTHPRGHLLTDAHACYDRHLSECVAWLDAECEPVQHVSGTGCAALWANPVDEVLTVYERKCCEDPCPDPDDHDHDCGCGCHEDKKPEYGQEPPTYSQRKPESS